MRLKETPVSAEAWLLNKKLLAVYIAR